MSFRVVTIFLALALVTSLLLPLIILTLLRLLRNDILLRYKLTRLDVDLSRVLHLLDELQHELFLLVEVVLLPDCVSHV